MSVQFRPVFPSTYVTTAAYASISFFAIFFSKISDKMTDHISDVSFCSLGCALLLFDDKIKMARKPREETEGKSGRVHC